MEDVQKHTVYLLYFGMCQKKVAMEEVDYRKRETVYLSPTATNERRRLEEKQ